MFRNNFDLDEWTEVKSLYRMRSSEEADKKNDVKKRKTSNIFIFFIFRINEPHRLFHCCCWYCTASFDLCSTLLISPVFLKTQRLVCCDTMPIRTQVRDIHKQSPHSAINAWIYWRPCLWMLANVHTNIASYTYYWPTFTIKYSMNLYGICHWPRPIC